MGLTFNPNNLKSCKQILTKKYHSIVLKELYNFVFGIVPVKLRDESQINENPIRASHLDTSSSLKFRGQTLR